MTKDDITRMAKEAGFERTKMHKALERFAIIVAAAEREACANVCDSYDVADDVCSSDTAEGIAIAIRARWQS